VRSIRRRSGNKEENQTSLELLITYATQQGLISRRLDAGELW